ncbi:maleylpyruvate isomerase family mycothiol-dependent enzyme [Nocardia callitridis]|uniref:Maleylpyruvate isomerase family mycothiol-dependent enzyme n=1 Tax=Nocardia callitridis TaxID=648753 RepID=A0ABP9JY70_9NOCA
MTSTAREHPSPDHVVALDTVEAATTRLFDTARTLSDDDLAGPSLLPGWTRGHVLAHFARNADSLVNLLLWARTGIEIPQYASTFLRDHDIEAGAPRPIAEQVLDNETAAERWLALGKALSQQQWEVEVRTRQGHPIRATEVRWMRLQEAEIHHVDLNVAYQPSDWPTDFVERVLTQASADLDRSTAEDTVSFTVRATDLDFSATIGPDPTATITGPASSLAAWLLGRSPGEDLTGDVPALPAWK